MKGDIIYYHTPNFRSRKWEAVFEKTKLFIHLIFDKRENLDCTAVELHFPERFLNEMEQQELFAQMEYYAPNLDLVVIHTNNKVIAEKFKDKGLVDYISEFSKALQDPYSDELEIPKHRSPV